MGAMKGIVTKVMPTRMCPRGAIFFMRDVFSHPEVADSLFDGDIEEVDGIIVLIRDDDPEAIAAAQELVGEYIEIDSSFGK